MYQWRPSQNMKWIILYIWFTLGRRVQLHKKSEGLNYFFHPFERLKRRAAAASPSAPPSAGSSSGLVGHWVGEWVGGKTAALRRDVRLHLATPSRRRCWRCSRGWGCCPQCPTPHTRCPRGLDNIYFQYFHILTKRNNCVSSWFVIPWRLQRPAGGLAPGAWRWVRIFFGWTLQKTKLPPCWARLGWGCTFNMTKQFHAR